jgi:hypothetical protein
MGATRPHNPAARGELLGATAPWQNRSRSKKNKPTLNTKLRILPKFGLESCGTIANTAHRQWQRYPPAAQAPGPRAPAPPTRRAAPALASPRARQRSSAHKHASSTHVEPTQWPRANLPLPERSAECLPSHLQLAGHAPFGRPCRHPRRQRPNTLASVTRRRQ